LPDEQVRAWVASSMNVGEDDAALIALLADGSIGRAASLDLEYLRGARLTLFTDLAAAPANDTVAALALAERLLEVDPELRQGLDLLGSFVRDAVVWRLEGERRVRNRDVLPLIESYAGRMTTTNLSRKIRSLTQAKRLVERNVAKTAVAAGLCVDLLSPQPTAFTRGRLPR
jgi:DNA polymerase-3 subunit delta'